jgi:branched-chain amino acid transport system permease protein
MLTQPLRVFAMPALLAVLYGLVPLLASPYQIYVIDTIVIASIGAMGLNLLTGHAGQVSVGMGGFLGVGAFTSALLVSRLALPIWVGVPVAALTTGVVGVLFGLPSARIKGLYLAIATLAAQVIIEWVLNRPAIAGGGSVPAPRPALLQDDTAYYFLLLTIAVLTIALARKLLCSRIGMALSAVRDNEVAASVVGVDVARHKLLAFGLSSFYAGLAGALLGHLGQAVNVEQFQLQVSIQYLAMIVIGGLGTIRGSILGAIFVTVVPIVLRLVGPPVEALSPDLSTTFVSSIQVILFGVVIVVFMIIEPHGLARLASRAGTAADRWFEVMKRRASSFSGDGAPVSTGQRAVPARGAGAAALVIGPATGADRRHG